MFMTNVLATATGGANAYGVSVRLSSSPTMTNVHARASGGTSNYGMYIEGSDPFIQGSMMDGMTEGLWFDLGSAGTRVVNSRLSSVYDGAPNSIQCRETFDNSLADVDC